MRGNLDQLLETLQAKPARFWTSLAESRRKFAECDEGADAEGFTDVVVQALARHWDRAKDLDRLAAKDSGLRAFVLKHVDGTADVEVLQQARANATSHCDIDKSLCDAIARAAKGALHVD